MMEREEIETIAALKIQMGHVLDEIKALRLSLSQMATQSHLESMIKRPEFLALDTRLQLLEARVSEYRAEALRGSAKTWWDNAIRVAAAITVFGGAWAMIVGKITVN